MSYDVAIVGGGPAGGMAALTLAGSGARVALLEKARMPRHKACGGGMTASVGALLGPDLEPLVQARAHRRRCFLDYSQPVDSRMKHPILMVDRATFDLHLLERAMQRSRGDMRLLEGFEVRQVSEDDHGVTLVNDAGEKVRARRVIAADGAYSRVRQVLGLERHAAWMAAIDAEVRVSAEVWQAHQDTATFNYSCLPGGYGWVFPKAGLLSCGVGSVRRGLPLRRHLREFLRRTLDCGLESAELHAHNIPYYHDHRRLATRHVVFVGDAAGVADPLMGEGILPGLKTGALAARFLLSEPEHCHGYEALVREALGERFWRLSRIGADLLVGQPQLFYRNFIQPTGRSAQRLSDELLRRHRQAVSDA